MTREKAIENLKGLLESNYVDSFEDEENESLRMAIQALEQEPCDDAISREAVVDDFIEWREKLEYAVGEDYSGVHLLNVSIQKIWDMPSVTPKPTECEDAVSRQAVIGELKDMYEAAKRWSQDATEDDIKARADAVMATLIEQKLRVEALPSVTPQPKMGHWINKEYRKEEYILTGTCSVCGRGSIIDEYCPNCGACMKDGRTLDEFIEDSKESEVQE